MAEDVPHVRPAWLIEVALLAAVLVPVACSATVRRAAVALGPVRQVVLGAMLVLALAAQLALGPRTFPFVDWRMYSSLPKGDPVVLEYDVALAGGGRDALVPGRYLAPESADRLVEALRRQVESGRRADLAAALDALAGLYVAREGRRVASVIVSERRISIATGRRGAPRELVRVAVR